LLWGGEAEEEKDEYSAYSDEGEVDIEDPSLAMLDGVVRTEAQAVTYPGHFFGKPPSHDGS
jgi:hypothetical protein